MGSIKNFSGGRFSSLILVLTSVVKKIRMTKAKNIPVAIATSSKSPCGSPSMETLVTKIKKKFFYYRLSLSLR